MYEISHKNGSELWKVVQGFAQTKRGSTSRRKDRSYRPLCLMNRSKTKAAESDPKPLLQKVYLSRFRIVLFS
ncbi:hypothetical protein N7490_006308 [Penicillium lividum]|nr:hypothetical protein N7490_006308 [Penicillium lividum]